MPAKLIFPLMRCQWRDVITSTTSRIRLISAKGFSSSPGLVSVKKPFSNQCVPPVTLTSLSTRMHVKPYLMYSNGMMSSNNRINSLIPVLVMNNVASTDSASTDSASLMEKELLGTTGSNRNNGGNRHKCLPSLLLAFAFPWAKKSDDEEKVDPIVMTLKRGVLATQKQNFDEAQELFHQALELGNQQHKQQKIDDSQHLIMKVNIFGLMAEASMKAADYKNAEKLYKEIMKLCIASGKNTEDPAMVELSIKLASMYAMQSRDDEADTGFKFCLEATRKAIEKSGGILEADTNLLALHGLTCQSYARFLMKIKQYSKAIELYTSSLDVAKEVYGSDHPQTLVILNDIASAHIISGKHSEGVRYYKEAVDRASRMENMEDSLVAFHYNLGEALILMKEFDEADDHCKQSLQFAKQIDNPMLIKMAKQCLSDVVQVRKKQKK